MKSVDFYYGLGSRYSYIAASQIERIENEIEVNFKWIPICSGKLMELSDVNPFAAENVRGQYETAYRMLDAQRWANYYDIPYVEPDIEDVDWSLIVRACLVARQKDRIGQFSLAVYDEVFGTGAPPRSAKDLARLAEKVGLSGEDLISKLNSGSETDEEIRILEHARDLKVFGVPTFVVDEELFWGQDRIPLLLQYLKSTS